MSKAWTNKTSEICTAAAPETSLCGEFCGGLEMAISGFESACADFGRFSAQQGYPSQLLWIERDCVRIWRRRYYVWAAHTEAGRQSAAFRFAAAAQRNSGVWIEALARTETVTICHLRVPENEADAEEKWIPPAGVKMSVRVDPAPVTLVRGRLVWRFLRRFGAFSAHFGGVL